MNFTLQSMIDALNTLAVGTIYKYASAGRVSTGACELVSVDSHTGAIQYRRTSDGAITSETRIERITGENVAKLAAALNTRKAVEINALYGGSGNFRSALEALAANTANIFVCQIDGKKHIFWNPDLSHPVGVVTMAEPPVVYVPSPTSIRSLLPHDNFPRQRITYGAPGTGKSHKIEEVVGKYADTVRTTFHPDSDYSTFVGCYKPTMDKKPRYGQQGLPIKVNGVELTEDIISYSYIPQAFTKAYVRTWSKLFDTGKNDEEKRQYLVIEEINRGNCAQIFGDLFQLLDRKGDWYSKYPIEADTDLARYINEELGRLPQEVKANIPAEVLSGAKLILPPNLYIWATMNTSDQSLFPMDSAFKRRWEWEYIPIKNAGEEDSSLVWKIVADGEEFPWWDFLKTINKCILDALKNEDKQLGYFFARPDDDTSDVIPASKFVNKVFFYLYNDVFKDYELPKGFAKSGGGKFAFADFFLADGKPDETKVKE